MHAVSHLTSLCARWSIGLALLSALTLGCSPSLRDDVYACSGSGANDCPLGYTCVSGRCRAPLDVPECRFDYECLGRDCLEASCEGGYCVRSTTPATDGTPCRDELACNGDEFCFGGFCQPGSPPCLVCDEETGCIDCGSAGSTCCPGDFCFEGQCSGPGGACVACGDVEGGPCCNDSTCAPGFICGGETKGPTACYACGDLGEFPCETGCNEGVVSLATYLCTEYAQCGLCGPGSSCTPNPDETAFQCEACGIEGARCCPGEPSCQALSGGVFPCYRGSCVDFMVEPL
jgi:hypothetical protein